jgi:hypothetical protein
MPDHKNTLYREMVLDLLYRLRLAEDLFCQTTESVMSAMSLGEVSAKKEAMEQLCAYAKSLKVVYADFLHLAEGLHAMFPADISLWQWNEPDGEEVIARTLDRLHTIAEGMEMKLNTEILKWEVRQ